MEGATAQLWTDAQFESARDAWSELLSRSDCDRLFMSWDWQWRWWIHHRAELGAQLRLLAIHAADGRLIGLAPFFTRTVRTRRVLRTRRVELIGGSWRDDTGAFSEYLDVIADRSAVGAVADAVAAWLRSGKFWHEMALACVRRSSVAAMLAERLLGSASVREVDPFEAHRIPLPAQASDYISRLPASARRKIFGQRSRLEPASVTQVSEEGRDAALGRMDGLIRERWSRDALSAASHRFRADFTRAMARQGHLQLTELKSAGETVAVLYNVRVGGVEYYLQSGFDESRSRGVSLGYLHLGYALETACAAGVERFDLLGGRGLNRDYKHDFGTEREELLTLHVVRAPWLRALHALRRHS